MRAGEPPDNGWLDESENILQPQTRDSKFVQATPLGLESRSGRMFVIEVVHTYCFKLFQALECEGLSMVQCC